MPFVSKPVEINGNLYLDGGISDPVPFKKVLETKPEKIIVVLTRPSGYRKKNLHARGLYQLFYGRFPNFVKTGSNRHQTYNETMDLIEKYEAEHKIIVLRPSRFIKIKRIEKDTAKLQSIYDLGTADCVNKLDEIRKYLKD